MDSTSQTDGASSIWFTEEMQIQKFNNTALKCSVFRAISRMKYVLKKVFFISDRFKCKILLNHYAWKFYLKLPENKRTRQKLYCSFRQVKGDIWENSVATFYNPF